MNKQPVGTFTATHANGHIEILTFWNAEALDVAHCLIVNETAYANTIDRRDARAILRVWNARGIVS